VYLIGKLNVERTNTAATSAEAKSMRTEEEALEPYTLDRVAIPDMERRLKKLARRAIKLGVTPPTYEIVGEGFRVYQASEGAPKIKVPTVDIRIIGEKIGVPGYSLIASVEHLPHGNLVNVVPTAEVEMYELAPFRTAKPYCEHCAVPRRRKHSFIVREEETGELKQVGRNCLADFFGHDPKMAVMWAKSLLSFEDALEEESEPSYGGSYGYPETDLKQFLEFTAAAMTENEGVYVSKRAAENDYSGRLTPTAWRVDTALFGKKREDRLYPSPEDKELARKAMEWSLDELRSKDPMRMSDYEHNLLVILEGGYVGNRMGGYAASIIPYYQRAMGNLVRRKLQAKQREQSKWLGEIKERLRDIPVTLERLNSFESQYGTVWIYKFRSDDGDAITWFASSGQGIAIGDRGLLTATVKKHEEYKGEKQTVVTRGKWVAE
jgi:hypothetical protein